MSSFFLSVVQGISEFLPVSSSAHLLMFSKWFEFDTPSLNTMISLHLGTLFAVLLYYAKDVVAMIVSFVQGALCPNKRDNKYFKMALCILIASIPAVIFGFLLKPYVKELQENLLILGICSIIFGGLLAFVDSYSSLDQDEITLKKACLIGIAQAIAVIPGSSRLGMTVTMARILGLSRSGAFKFSMFLSIPAVTGATTLMLIDQKSICYQMLFTESLLTFVIGYVTLFLTQRYIDRIGFRVFGYYRILFGFIILWWSFMEGYKVWF